VSYWAPENKVADDKLPSIAVEVRSRSQTLEEVREKCRVFRRSGVEACWLIDPVSRSAEIFEGRRDGVPVSHLTAACMPGFELAVADLFSALEQQNG
jgi:Uma2 family endonuclease